MKIQCPDCQHLNGSDAIFCSNCRALLHSPEQAIRLLQSKQEDIQQEFSAEMNRLKLTIDAVGKAIASTEIREAPKPVEIPKIEPIQTEHEKPVEKVLETAHSIPAPKAVQEDHRKKIVPKEPSRLDPIGAFFEPIFSGIGLINNLYLKYKAEGQLPIFFMTIGGAAALLFGFGYFLQYSLQYIGIYAAVVKIGLGFGTSAALLFFGFRLYGKKVEYHDYASALLSIGIVLNYLLIYFMSDLGDFPMLSSAIFGFVLIIINTLAAISIALKFKTKIISVLSLVGGSLAPFYLNSTSDGTLYFIYLWMLMIASVYLAYQIKWDALKYLAFIIGFGLLQGGVFNYASEVWVYNIYYHLYTYLFFYIVFFDRLELKSRLTKNDVILLAGALAFLIFNLFYTLEDQLLLLGIIYLTNAIIFSFISWKWWLVIDQKIKWTLVAVVGTLVGFAIPSIFDQSLMGLMWSIEAMALIALGFIHTMPMVRKEGYIILAIGAFKMLTGSSLIWLMWGKTIWHEGMISFGSFILVLVGLWLLFIKFRESLDELERIYLNVIRELVAPCLLIIFMAISYHIIGIWCLNLTFVTFFGLLVWSDHFKTRVSSLAAYASLSLLLLSYAISFAEVMSYHFSDQRLSAQIALLELFGILWLSQEYYEKRKLLYHDFLDWAKNLRVLFFFLIPLIVLYLVNKHLHALVISGFWLSTMVAYGIHRLRKQSIYFYEFCGLLFFAISLSVSDLAIIHLAVGIASLIALIIFEKGLDEKAVENSGYNIILKGIPYAIVSLIALISLELFNHLGLAVALASTLLLGMIALKDHVTIMKSTMEAGIKISNALILYALVLCFFDRSFFGEVLLFASISLFGMMLFRQKTWYESVTQQRLNIAHTTFQIEVLLFYTLVLIQMGFEPDGAIYSIVLVIHGIVVLFLFLKTAQKIFNRIGLTIFAIALAKVIFNDIRDFAMMQKVLVLILIGVILLSASFVYIKLKKKYQPPKDEVDEDIKKALSD